MFSPIPPAISFAAMLAAIPVGALAQETRTFLYGNFLCSDGAPQPSVTRTQERYFHEIRHGDSTQRQVCATVSGFSILSQLPLQRRIPRPTKQVCETFDLVSYTVMCKGGAVSAPRFFIAADEDRRIRDGRGPFKIAGDTLLAPIYSSYSGPPEAYVPLPTGYGFPLNISASTATVTLPWERIASGAAIIVTGAISEAVPEAAPAAGWVRLLATAWPWPQLYLGFPLLAYAVIGLIGKSVDASEAGPRTGLVVLFAVAALGLLLTPKPASFPDAAAAEARSEIDAAARQREQAERDRQSLRGLIRISSTGMVEPFSASELERVKALVGSRVIAASPIGDSHPTFWAITLLLPSLVFPLVYLPAFLRGWHYLFVAHPAAPIVSPPLRSGGLFDARALGNALRSNAPDLHNHPPAYQSQNLFAKARALKEKIQTDAEIADAAMRRDRARAQQMQAEAELRAARSKLPWWQRWMWR